MDEGISLMRLLLFDIDGTLIYANRTGRAALLSALEQTFGVSGPADQYDMSGKTDPQIIMDLMTAAGIPTEQITARLSLVYKHMVVKGHQVFTPENGLKPCPGVLPLLTALRQRPDVVLGLLTGNIAATAPLKLAAAGIDPAHFRLGAYGSDAADRNLLPPIAMQRATQLTGHLFNQTNTTIIGDTPADILCARSANATSVAVATGRYTTATLSHYRPHHLLENLLDTETVLQKLLPGVDQVIG